MSGSRARAAVIGAKPNSKTDSFKVVMTGLCLVVVLVLMLAALPARAALKPFVAERTGSLTHDNRHGDFNGDGTMDEVFTVLEGEGKEARIGIHIRLSQGNGFVDQQVTAVSVRDGYALSVSTPQAFRTDCGTYSEGCEATPITPANDSLIVSMDHGIELLVYFDKGQFEQNFVASDEGLLRRTLRAYYALQP